MRLIAFLNSYTKGISGGDIRFIEIAKRMKGVEKIVITSRLGCSLCQKRSLYAKYIFTTKEQDIKSTTSLYIRRIFKALSLNLGKYFNNEDNTIIYSTSDFLPDVLPSYWFKLKYKAKWIQLIHHLYKNPLERIGNNFSANLLGYLSQKICFFFIKYYSDIIIVVNQLTKEDLIKLGFKEFKIMVVPNGIDINYIKNIDRYTEKSYDAVFMGRLNRSKGIFDLIKIWSLTIKKLPDVKLGIIGGGDDNLKKELIIEIKKYNLSKNIDILGYIESDDAYSIIKASKIFVFPSHEEGFGIVILEAMACGLPVVTWNLPIYSHIYNDSLIQIKENEIEKFSDAIICLLSNNLQYNQFKKASMNLSKKYDWDKSANIETGILYIKR